MKQYVRCKACGYITEAGKDEKGCAACGVPKTAFEPYKMTISEKRKKMLDMHLHPIILHFPQAFVVFGLILVLLGFVMGESFRENIETTAKIVIISLPFVVVLGFVTGLYDGKLRFKKVTTPILVIKMIAGAVFFVLSVVSAVLIFIMDFDTTLMVIEAILLFIGSLTTAVLGKLGSSLLDAKLPG